MSTLMLVNKDVGKGNVIYVNISHSSMPLKFLCFTCLLERMCHFACYWQSFRQKDVRNLIYDKKTKLPLSKPRTSDAVEHNSGGKLGPITNAGRMVIKLIPFLLQNSHAAFSASVFDKAYQIFISIKKKKKRKGK